MKVLIIEDDQSLANSLRQHLKKKYTVDLAFSGQEGLNQAFINPYSVIVLDLQLPDINGCQICQELREAELNTPILIISGKKHTDDKISLLDAGADDYLIKPFDTGEFQARIRTLSRRTDQPLKPNILRVDKLSLNCGDQRAFYKKRPLNLSKKEFLLLQILMSNPNIVFTRNQLFDKIWESDRCYNSNTVDVHICNLRKKIGLAGRKLIQTSYGSGYILRLKKRTKGSN